VKMPLYPVKILHVAHYVLERKFIPTVGNKKLKHFTHEALFHVTVTIFEVFKQREVNASELHLRHLFHELLIISLMNIDISS
jgi:hypothetical protein